MKVQVLGTLLSLLLINSVQANNDELQQELCNYVKQDKHQSLFSAINSKDMRLSKNYRKIICAPELNFEGGSLIKTADHFGSKKTFSLLLSAVSIDDIFWEAKLDAANTRIIAYKD